jgi:hypothetical protein
MIILHRYADLLEIVDTLGAPGCFTRGLDSGQQERNKNADNGDHDQEFYKGKATCARFHGLAILPFADGGELLSRGSAQNIKLKAIVAVGGDLDCLITLRVIFGWDSFWRGWYASILRSGPISGN